MEKSTLDAPTMNPFQDVRIPHIAATIMSFPTSGLPVAYAKQFATGTQVGSLTYSARTSPGVDMATPSIIIMYHPAAMQMAIIITFPILPRGMFISSAA